MPRTTSCANAWCSNEIDARRASLGRIGRQDFALCVPCNDANLAHDEDAPQYETATLEAASASYDRAPNPYAYGVPS